MSPRTSFLAHSRFWAANSRSVHSGRWLAALVGRSGLVFVFTYLVPHLGFAAGEVIGIPIASRYGFDEWARSWAAWYTWIGSLLLGPFVVALLTIVASRRRWFAAVAVAMLSYTAVQIWLDFNSPFYYDFPNTPIPDGVRCLWASLWWAVPIASLLLAAGGTALGVVVQHRRGSQSRLGSSGPVQYPHGLAMLLAQSGFAFACIYLAPHLCIRVEEVLEELILGRYRIDPCFSAWSQEFTWLVAALLGPFMVTTSIIAVGGKRWLTAIAIALPSCAAFQIWVACHASFSSDISGLDGGGGEMVVLSSLLAIAGAALGMAMHRRRDRRSAKLKASG